ncbi:LytTR family DNA-binding domain-containing protein [uncultured Dokdonia sp.]|uniref:LytR/AlgR family response regulator transcription factor n=1 Tax=uncultured Dokdonia sp. TaxID=575653 RepID=UPI002630ADAD|nr:LytTR family DNA-binding domain-containing protein [uncultured Dokdonia sp.]
MSTKQPAKNTPNTRDHSTTRRAAWNLFKKVILFVIFSLVVNHLATRESFPDGESYRFPLEGFLSSLALCTFIGIIAYLNFKFYERKYFSKKVEIKSISWYMVTTLGYITIMYIPLGILLNKIAGGETEFYYLLTGLLVTLLVSFILIGFAYSLDIYNLYKLSIKDAEITIESGATITKLSYDNIACFYSENKIVYAVQKNGKTITSDFTLNALEEKINDQLFFRANRQIILHKDAVDHIEKIENSKLRVQLKTAIENKAIHNITISRYKREAFMNWFQ